MDTEPRRFMKHHLPYTSISHSKGSTKTNIPKIGERTRGHKVTLIQHWNQSHKVTTQTDPVDTRNTQIRGGVQFETYLPPDSSKNTHFPFHAQNSVTKGSGSQY